MKKTSTKFLKFVIIMIASVTLAGLLFFPQVEGRNINADFYTIYFKDPFLAYVYLASVPYFGALYQAFKLLGFIELNQTFTQLSSDALRKIKYYLLAFSGFIGFAIPYIVMFAHDDDSPGVVLIAFFAIFACIVVSTAASIFQKLLQNAIDIKSENDLTV